MASSRAGVSPITIRLRILKALDDEAAALDEEGFTHYDPFEDTERAYWAA